MRVTRSIEIAAEPADVFPWLDDPELAKRWMTSVAESRILHETPDRIGTTFVETVADGSGSTEMRGTVVSHEPDRSLAMHLVGERHEVDVEFRLERIPGGTRLTQTADLRFRGSAVLMGVFLGPFVKRKILSQLEGEHGHLRRLCEEA
jgi:carbon monoxide dehydrogenase subunit G